MSRTMYLVVRRAIDQHGGACEDAHGDDTGSRVPVQLFATRARADAFAARLCAEARRTMNPFPLIDGYLSADEKKQLADFKLPVSYPDDDWHEDWTTWFDLCQDLITDEQRTAVWALLSTTPPFEVVAIGVSDE
jgi:hypothetical protein